eukprot:645299-Amorphochlora_amoeboformis.AAC.1
MTPLLLSLFIIPLCTSIDQKSIVFGAKNAENSGNNLRIFPHVVNGHGMGLSGHASGALGGRGTQGEEGQGPHPGGGPKDPGDNGNNGGMLTFVSCIRCERVRVEAGRGYYCIRIADW